MEQESTIQEPVTISGGDSAVNFDDLERLDSASEVREKTAGTSAPTKKETKDGNEEKGKSESKAKSKDKEVEEPKEEKKSQDPKATLEKESQGVKTYKLRNGETETEVAAESMVPVKVNGKTEMVKLQEVLNGYSGQSHLDRQFNQFKKEKTEFESQRSALVGVVSKINQALSDGDFRGFVDIVAESMGQDPDKIYNEMIGKIEEKAEQTALLSDEEKTYAKSQRELEYYKSKEQKLKEAAAKQKEFQTLDAKVQKILDTSKLDKQTFVNRYEEIVKLGSVKPQDITPEMVAKYHSNMVKIETVEKVIEELAPELENKIDEVNKLASYAIQIDASDEDIKEAVKQLYSNQSERKLTRKIEKMERKSRGEQAVRDPQTDPTFFEELV